MPQRTHPPIPLLAVLAFLILFVGCEEYIDYSPYEVETERHEHTAKNLARLDAISSNSFVPFKFAVLSDSHSGYDELSDAVSRVNRRDDISFVLHAGDLTESGLLKEFEWTDEILRDLKVPHLTVIGNHDAINNGKQNYAAIYGDLNYSFVFNQVKFVALNSNSWEFNNTVPELPWLQTQLADYALYPHQIVLTHILPQDVRFSDDFEASYITTLKDNFVSLIIGGHSHNYRYQEELLSSGAPIGFLVAGSTLKFGYAVVSVDVDGVSVERVGF